MKPTPMTMPRPLIAGMPVNGRVLGDPVGAAGRAMTGLWFFFRLGNDLKAAFNAGEASVDVVESYRYGIDDIFQTTKAFFHVKKTSLYNCYALVGGANCSRQVDELPIQTSNSCENCNLERPVDRQVHTPSCFPGVGFPRHKPIVTCKIQDAFSPHFPEAAIW